MITSIPIINIEAKLATIGTSTSIISGKGKIYLLIYKAWYVPIGLGSTLLR